MLPARAVLDLQPVSFVILALISKEMAFQENAVLDIERRYLQMLKYMSSDLMI
jgi:hypothetical protein